MTGDYYYVLAGSGLEKKNYSLPGYSSCSAEELRDKLYDSSINTKAQPVYLPE